MIQDPTKDPYGNLIDKAANAPKKDDIVSGNFPGSKAAEAPKLVDAFGYKLETPSGKERREMREQKKRMNTAQFKFHITTFSQYCEDDIVRMMFQITNENPANGRKTVLMDFGYTEGQLENFKNAIKDHETEIHEAKLKEGIAASAPVPPDDNPVGDAV